MNHRELIRKYRVIVISFCALVAWLTVLTIGAIVIRALAAFL